MTQALDLQHHGSVSSSEEASYSAVVDVSQSETKPMPHDFGYEFAHRDYVAASVQRARPHRGMMWRMSCGVSVDFPNPLHLPEQLKAFVSTMLCDLSGRKQHRRQVQVWSGNWSEHAKASSQPPFPDDRPFGAFRRLEDKNLHKGRGVETRKQRRQRERQGNKRKLRSKGINSRIGGLKWFSLFAALVMFSLWCRVSIGAKHRGIRASTRM